MSLPADRPLSRGTTIVAMAANDEGDDAVQVADEVEILDEADASEVIVLEEDVAVPEESDSEDAEQVGEEAEGEGEGGEEYQFPDDVADMALLTMEGHEGVSSAASYGVALSRTCCFRRGVLRGHQR